MQDILNNRLNRLRYSLSVSTSTEKFLARRQELRDNEISQIPQGLVSARRGELFPDEFQSPPGPDFLNLLQLFLLMIVLSGQNICQMCHKLL